MEVLKKGKVQGGLQRSEKNYKEVQILVSMGPLPKPNCCISRSMERQIPIFHRRIKQGSDEWVVQLRPHLADVGSRSHFFSKSVLPQAFS